MGKTSLTRSLKAGNREKYHKELQDKTTTAPSGTTHNCPYQLHQSTEFASDSPSSCQNLKPIRSPSTGRVRDSTSDGVQWGLTGSDNDRSTVSFLTVKVTETAVTNGVTGRTKEVEDPNYDVASLCCWPRVWIFSDPGSRGVIT